jgi:type I restriction-modification system DNA methylase subunit
MSLDLPNIVDHTRNRTYMGGVERDRLRVKATGEVFTPAELVREMLEQIPVDQFTDPAKTFLDPSCGDGQFLGEVLIRKIENGIDFETALSTIYGVDLMQDNVELCRERLLCGRNDLRHIVEQNIVCADALRYHYRFDSSHPYDNERKEQEFEDRLAKFVEIG